MAQQYFSVGDHIVRCSKLATPETAVQFGEMLRTMNDDAIITAFLANHLKEFEPEKLGNIANDLSLAPEFVAQWLMTMTFAKKSSWFYTPVYTEPPFVEEPGIYFGIKASQEKTKELHRDWSLGNVKQFMSNHKGVVKSSVAPQWVYLLSKENVHNIDTTLLFDNEDQERIQKVLPLLIPEKYGISQKLFSKIAFADKVISFNELDKIVHSTFCTVNLDHLSPYHTFYKQTEEGYGWGIKYHTMQEEFPQGDKTVLNPVFNPDVDTMVIDIILWKDDVTRGELCKIGFYYQEDGKKIINIVPPFPQAPSAIKKDKWTGEEDFDEMVIKEYLPCHFQADEATISKFLSQRMSE